MGLLRLLFLDDAEEVAPTIEVFFQNESHALGVKAVAGKIAVVGLVVDTHRKVAVGEYEVAKVKVADETGGGIGIVAVPELAIDQQPVVEQPPA